MLFNDKLFNATRALNRSDYIAESNISNTQFLGLVDLDTLTWSVESNAHLNVFRYFFVKLLSNSQNLQELLTKKNLSLEG